MASVHYVRVTKTGMRVLGGRVSEMHRHCDLPCGYKSGQSVRRSERLDYIVGYCVASLILGLTEEAAHML